MAAEPHIPPMPEKFYDEAAWMAIHWRPSLKGSCIDAAVILWQLDNQDRVRAALAASAVSRTDTQEDG